MIDGYSFKDNYTCEDLLEIVRILRAPGGCPWDAEQTHESIKKSLIEETYEVIEAIDKNSPVMLEEELGDVLLQVVMHAQMEDEKGVFDFGRVCDGICKKLIVRHPHVFGDVNVSSSEEVLTNWDAIKMSTKHQKSTTESMLSVPRELPALMRSQKIQHKAAKVGFDWDDVSGAIAKIREETDETEKAIAGGNADEIADEVGDILFSAVNAARLCGVDAEEALTKSADKFLARFSVVEKKAAERNIDMKSSSIEVLDELWDEAKKEM